MAREEFSECPQCGIGTLKPTGEAAKMTDPDTGTVTNDYNEYNATTVAILKAAKPK